MAQETDVTLPNVGNPVVRMITVTTLVNGVSTPVQMQVIALADDGGNIIRDFASYNLQIAMIAELRAIRRILANQNGIFDPVAEGPAIGSTQQ